MPHDSRDTRSRMMDEWTAVARGWRRWEPHITAFTWPVTQRMADALRLSPGDHVLDVGCGIGDPALALAQKTAPDGKVLAVDPVVDMIDTARTRAESLALDNLEFRVAAVEDLDLPPHSFDAVCGRWSFIFCADIGDVLKRARGWLRPGGRFAISAWTPMHHSPGFKAVNVAVNRQVALPPPDAAMPGMLQLSEPGQLEHVLRTAGFTDISVQQVQLSIVVRDGDAFWNLMAEMGGSLNKVLNTLTPQQRETVGHDVASAVQRFDAGGVLRIPALAQLAAASA